MPLPLTWLFIARKIPAHSISSNIIGILLPLGGPAYRKAGMPEGQRGAFYTNSEITSSVMSTVSVLQEQAPTKASSLLLTLGSTKITSSLRSSVISAIPVLQEQTLPGTMCAAVLCFPVVR
ncbi:hypothetical protein D3A96_14715 [Robertkochia marina]|nr:hypothetical protein D3A96_14715 [Robertkochia marina]